MRKLSDTAGRALAPTNVIIMRSLSRTTSMLLASCALAACSGHSAASSGAAAPAPASAQGEAAAIAKARADSIRYPYTAADVHFMQGMIGHHSQAIAMASWAPSHGASASVAASGGAHHQRAAGRDRDHAAVAHGSASDGARGQGRSHEDDDEREGAGDAHAGHAHGGADAPARSRARARVRSPLSHRHDPAPQGRRLHGAGPLRHVRRRAGRARCSSSPPT